MLSLHGVSYRHAGAEQQTLVDVSLALAEGSIQALAGAAESGLSTLCLVLGGLAPRVVGGHLRGSVRIDGEDVSAWPMHRLPERVVVGLDRPAALLSMVADTVYEEVAFGPACLGLPRGEVMARTEAALASLDVEALAGRDPRQLSGGQQQLVALAGLLAMPARHLVLDEPLRHLDRRAGAAALRALQRAAADGSAVLIAEHRPEAAVSIADTLTLLASGRVVATGGAAELAAEPARWPAGPEAGEATPAARRHGSPGSPPGRVPQVALEDVTYRYPSGVTALEEVDLVIPAGQSVALVGANGSGKSTLLRHLDGLLRPTRGRVLVDEQDAAGRSVASLAATVALGFSDPDRQVFARTVHDEVAFGPRQLGRRGDELRASVDAALESVGLADAALTHPGDLGGSRRLLLVLASLLAMRTPVLALDEPTAGLDERARAGVSRLLRERHAAGGTVVVASHDLPFVAEVFERVVLLDGGRIVRDGPPHDVLEAVGGAESFLARDHAGS